MSPRREPFRTAGRTIVRLQVRVPDELADYLDKLATEHHRSLNAEINEALTEYVVRAEGERVLEGKAR